MPFDQQIGSVVVIVRTDEFIIYSIALHGFQKFCFLRLLVTTNPVEGNWSFRKTFRGANGLLMYGFDAMSSNILCYIETSHENGVVYSFMPCRPRPRLLHYEAKPELVICVY